MKKAILILMYISFFTSCQSKENKLIQAWNSRSNVPFEPCRIKDSLILIKLLDSRCSCESVVIDSLKYCDSLYFERLNQIKRSSAKVY